MKEINLRHSDVWTGRYRGVRFEIKRWRFSEDGKDYWAYYLYINEQQFPEDTRQGYVLLPKKDCKDRLEYDYEHCPWNEIRAHYGWTFYEIQGGYLDTPCVVQIGCDYSHYWDEGRRYNEKSIALDVKRSIDELHSRVKGFLVWSHIDGNYRTEVKTKAFEVEYRAKQENKHNVNAM